MGYQPCCEAIGQACLVNPFMNNPLYPAVQNFQFICQPTTKCIGVGQACDPINANANGQCCTALGQKCVSYGGVWGNYGTCQQACVPVNQPCVTGPQALPSQQCCKTNNMHCVKNPAAPQLPSTCQILQTCVALDKQCSPQATDSSLQCCTSQGHQCRPNPALPAQNICQLVSNEGQFCKGPNAVCIPNNPQFQCCASQGLGCQLNPLQPGTYSCQTSSGPNSQCSILNQPCSVNGGGKQCCDNYGLTCVNGACLYSGGNQCLSVGTKCTVMGKRCCYGICSVNRLESNLIMHRDMNTVDS